jgi:hypothetical protein
MADMETVYCVPIDEKGNEIMEDPVVEIPLGNMYSDEQSTNTLLRMLLNFGACSVLIIMTMFGAPFFYKFFITDIIQNENNDKFGSTTNVKKQDRLASSEILAIILMTITSSCMISGFSSTFNNQTAGMMGIFMIIILFIAFARIQFEKTMGTNEFYKKYLGIAVPVDGKDVDWGTMINFSKIMDTYEWLIYGTQIYGSIIFMIIAVTAIVLMSIYVGDVNPNPGIIIFAIWFPFYLNTRLFKDNSKPAE